MSASVLLLALLCCSALLLRAAPVISEFMADNVSGLTDAAGRNTDWIEIHNPTATAQEMSGWHLTDESADKTKWTFPSISIPPGGRLIVFASGDGVPNAGGALHTDFSLSSAGEYLALVAPDGITVASEFAPFPPQRENVSYGVTRQRFELVAPGAAGRAVAASASVAGEWRGGSEPFADTAWMPVVNGIGYNRTDQPVVNIPQPETAAYVVPQGTQGNQSYGGTLGMDFSVEQALTVTALGAFDSGSNGFVKSIRVQLWTRNENGTPDNFADDTGRGVLADITFSSTNPGMADGGSRFIALPTPVALPVGTYSIVAWGYGDAEMNGNLGVAAASWTTNSGNGSITFDGGGRFGDATRWPANLDGGPVNRYAAGTFKFITGLRDSRRTAYRVATGTAGNQDFSGTLGMDFNTVRTVRVTSLGVFDSGGNGLSSTITAQLWRRNENGTPGDFTDDTGHSILASASFTAANSGTLEGGSRFKPLATPLDLAPGAYTMVAYGYSAAEMNGNGLGAVSWNTDGGATAALQFVGGGRYGLSGGPFPNTVDDGPANRYAAGTFQYFDSSDPLIATSMDAAMFGVSPGAYLRLPFNVVDAAGIGSLELEMAWDDGFAAWINGMPQASRRAPALPVPTSTATSEGSAIETISMPAAGLQTGANVLAIHGLNIAANDADFLTRARLTGLGSVMLATYFLQPTPGAAEGSGVTGFVEPVTFSVPRGFYSAPISVTLNTATPAAEIRYTMNGSAPSLTSPLYTSPLSITGTMPLRAAAFLGGREASAPTTATYLFTAQIVQQPVAPAGYPGSWNAIAADYAMEDNATDLAAILAQPTGTPLATLRSQVEASLRTLPALCLTADMADIFGSTTGIYANPSGRGDLWEKACSAELIPAPGAAELGFQINGGLQVMGLTSRNLTVNPRLPLRVIFSRRFGPPSLQYPLFPGNPVTRFDSITLRGNTRDNFGNDINGTCIRDQWTKRLQADMGAPASSGRFFHVFINGLYWGIYNPTERPDGDFCQEHFGGDADEWDSITLCCPNRVKSGTNAKWQELLTLATQGFETDAKFQRILGNNPNGTRNPAYEILLDLDNFITFIVSGYYHASGDWPGNFYAMRRRGPQSTGFKFITWDSDIGLGWGNVNADKTVGDATGWWNNSPGQVELALRAHPEYRMQVSDAVQRHYFNGGACTPARSAARWTEIATALEPALGAECARWGDYRSPLGTLTRWRSNRNSYLTGWFPNRTGIVLNQLRNRGLFPAVNAPVLNQHGGPAAQSFSLMMTGTGSIYYTLDGSDPRLWGGAVKAGLTPYSTPVTLSTTTTVKSRARNGSVWSALTEATFLISPPASAATLVISEIHYNPEGIDDAELIEMMNTSTSTIDLSGVRFTAGLDFTFPAGTTLAAGARIVIVRDAAAFAKHYGTTVNVAGEFHSLTNLDNGGEHLTLLAANGSVIADFTYDDDAPWPNDADGRGYSLTLMNPSAHPRYDLVTSWRTSIAFGGSPGAGDATIFTGAASERLAYAGIALRWDSATGTARLTRHLAADDAIPLLETSTNLTHWTSDWTLLRRDRIDAIREELQFTPAPSPSLRVFLRASLP